ncbi:hypothetical protein SNEBB_004634 [Seison nebaliae]|nr:hypothetical protein SNEBB_004634 [Seison nebaliae]
MTKSHGFDSICCCKLSDVIKEIYAKFHFAERWMNKLHYIPIHLKDGIKGLYEELHLYNYASTEEFCDILNSLTNYKFFTEKLNEQTKDNYCKGKESYPSTSEVSNGEKFQQINNKLGFASVDILYNDLFYNTEKNSPVESREIGKNTPS